jgi:hypothetical protein
MNKCLDALGEADLCRVVSRFTIRVPNSHGDVALGGGALVMVGGRSARGDMKLCV